MNKPTFTQIDTEADVKDTREHDTGARTTAIVFCDLAYRLFISLDDGEVMDRMEVQFKNGKYSYTLTLGLSECGREIRPEGVRHA